MPMHISEYMILNTDFLICAHPCEGSGEHDGRYGIGCLIALEGTCKRVFFDFPSKETRDLEFVALGQAIQEDAPAEEKHNDPHT